MCPSERQLLGRDQPTVNGLMNQLSLLGQRMCAECGKAIPATRRSDAIYCSDACNKKASNKRCGKRVRSYMQKYYRKHKVKRPRVLKYENAYDMRLQKSYGINWQDWLRIRERQGGKCAICGTALCKTPSHRTHTDHCHETGQVRGILCTQCNTGIGSFRESLVTLQSAVSYLSEAGLGATT